MGTEDVGCAVCGKKMAYDDAYGAVEHADKTYQVCCKECMQRFAEKPESYAK
jgi:YHS domain-containing protein